MNGIHDNDDFDGSPEMSRTADASSDLLERIESMIRSMYGQGSPWAYDPRSGTSRFDIAGPYEYTLVDNPAPRPSSRGLDGFSGPSVRVTGTAPSYHVASKVSGYYICGPDGGRLPRGKIEPTRDFWDDFDLDTSVADRWKVSGHTRTVWPEVEPERMKVELPEMLR